MNSRLRAMAFVLLVLAVIYLPSLVSIALQIEKSRLIDIESIYVSLCGLAIIFLLSFRLQNKSPWIIWLPASIFLGLGILAKGPTHLVFFYALVVAVLWYSKDWRLLIHPAHF